MTLGNSARLRSPANAAAVPAQHPVQMPLRTLRSISLARLSICLIAVASSVEKVFRGDPHAALWSPADADANVSTATERLTAAKTRFAEILPKLQS
jgi:hypothetical protein